MTDATTLDPTDDEAVFAAIADERRALSQVLEGLSSEQWATGSLCDGWEVRDVASHLLMPLVTPMWRFVVAMAAARGSFDRANVRLTARTRRLFGDRLPEQLRARATSHFTPPGMGAMAPLSDVIIHGQDIRRPLGISTVIAPERQRAVLDFMVATPGGTPPLPVPDSELFWRATDLDWTHGSGPEITGPASSIMLVLTGRLQALDDLSGPGVDVLRSAIRRR